MTVMELLEAIIAAYPGASAEALKTFKPVFLTRLRHFEGDKLAAAAHEVLGTFSATARKPFPICADFEAHLPSGKLHIPDTDGPPMRARMEEQKRRKAEMVGDWQAGQGAKIKAARGPAIYAHCLWEAQRQAGIAAWKPQAGRVVLSAEQIQTCEDQAVSTARLSAHGAAVIRHGSNAEWDDQMRRCAALLHAGQWPKRMDDTRSDGAVLTPSAAMQNRLAELARKRRQGVTQPEMQAVAAQ